MPNTAGGGLRAWLMRHWYASPSPPWVLRGLSWMFRFVVWVRRHWLLFRVKPGALGVPVVVVGNITVGGAGKTPLVIWLAERLREWGWRPGIVSRGYGGRPQASPRLITGDSSPIEFGDEPVMMARRLHCPVVIGLDRLAAAQALQRLGSVDIILSDDGLQHYRLPRRLEIAVVDATLGLGNAYCLPAGPLREPAARLNSVDAVVVNGSGWKYPDTLEPRALSMRLEGTRAIPLHGGASRALIEFSGTTVHAVAGIGNPTRFFSTLSRLGLKLVMHPFPDHHPFQAADLDFADTHPVLMTEKDAIKCRGFANERCWVVPVSPEISAADTARVKELIQSLRP